MMTGGVTCLLYHPASVREDRSIPGPPGAVQPIPVPSTGGPRPPGGAHPPPPRSSALLPPPPAVPARRSQHLAPQAAPWNPRIAAGPRIEATKPVSGLPVTGRPGATPLPRRLLRGRPAVVLRPVNVPARMVETVLDPGKGRGG